MRLRSALPVLPSLWNDGRPAANHRSGKAVWATVFLRRPCFLPHIARVSHRPKSIDSLVTATRRVGSIWHRSWHGSNNDTASASLRMRLLQAVAQGYSKGCTPEHAGVKRALEFPRKCPYRLFSCDGVKATPAWTIPIRSSSCRQQRSPYGFPLIGRHVFVY